MNKEHKLLKQVQQILKVTEANGATKEEAHNAVLLAHELLIKHGLDMSQVEGATDKIADIKLQEVITQGNLKFRYSLGCTIATAFRCRVVVEQDSNQLCFIGHTEDVLVCAEVFERTFKFVYREARRRQREACKATGNGSHVVNTYAMGFIAGLKSHLDAQCVALMVVVPPEVDQKILEIETGKSIQRSICITKDRKGAAIYQEGYHDGKTYMNGERIERTS